MEQDSRTIVVCEPNVVAVGIDPGPSAGAVAVIRTDNSGKPEILELQEWRRDKRKRARGKFRVWRATSAQPWSETDEPLDHPDSLVVRLARYAAAERLHGESMSAAVENIQIYGPGIAGLMQLASSAGGHAALLRHVLEIDVQRPPERVWVRKVAAVPGRARKALTRRILTSCYEAAAFLDGVTVVEWRCRVDGPTPKEHAIDALGIALYAAGARVTHQQRRENSARS